MMLYSPSHMDRSRFFIIDTLVSIQVQTFVSDLHCPLLINGVRGVAPYLGHSGRVSFVFIQRNNGQGRRKQWSGIIPPPPGGGLCVALAFHEFNVQYAALDPLAAMPCRFPVTEMLLFQAFGAVVTGSQHICETVILYRAAPHGIFQSLVHGSLNILSYGYNVWVDQLCWMCGMDARRDTGRYQLHYQRAY